MTFDSIPYRTCKIEGIKYSIEKYGYTELDITMEREYKMHGLKMRVTNLGKVIIEEYGGPSKAADRKYFTDPDRYEAAQQWFKEGIEIMEQVKQAQEGNGVHDLGDIDYRLMLMVGRIFQNWTNIDLPEPLEEELQQVDISIGEQEKQEQEAQRRQELEVDK